MDKSPTLGLSKIPEITLTFWIIKIAATALGETGGDAVSMTMQLGYAVSSAIFTVIFVATVAPQIIVRSYHPLLYIIHCCISSIAVYHPLLYGASSSRPRPPGRRSLTSPIGRFASKHRCQPGSAHEYVGSVANMLGTAPVYD
jgi:hypothetical protein